MNLLPAPNGSRPVRCARVDRGAIAALSVSVALAAAPSWAMPILDSDTTGTSTLGASSVTSVGTSAIAGNNGMQPTDGAAAQADVNTTFKGNGLALTTISPNAHSTDWCGRAPADSDVVTSLQDGLFGHCAEAIAGGWGVSAGLDIIASLSGSTAVTFLPFAPVGNGGGAVPLPAPGSVALIGIGLAGLRTRRRR